MDAKRDYRRMMEEGFAAWRDVNPDGTPESRVAYLSDYIFDFTTYDDAIAEEFGCKALEVCRAISDRKTFEYIADPANYRWFLLMCNMPFFARRLNWGTSIRGAWWDTSTANGTELDTTGLWLDGEHLTVPLTFSTDQWQEFIAALLAFGVEADANPVQVTAALPMTEAEYEYGYTITAGGETMDVVLGEFGQDELEENQRRLDTANRGGSWPEHSRLGTAATHVLVDTVQCRD